MKIVDFQKNQKDSFINIEDIDNIGSRIYCYKSDNGELFFLKSNRTVYWWNSLTLENEGYSATYETLKEALMSCSCQRVMIFNNQCEVKDYVKNM